MDITVTSRHLDITDAIKEYASSKVVKLSRYLSGRVQSIDVVTDRHDHHSFEVEIILKAAHSDPFIAKAHGDDLYACIDEAETKLERQLKDHKEKLVDRKQQG